ncbi:MAG: hypothetical protein IKW89_14310 [Bacteroidales bacterium]|nr:hypothetical protein [Bacteroidales bacterium]
MRRLWLIILLSQLPVLLFGQDIRKIKEDPSFLWGEGTGKDYESMQASAVDALIQKLSSTDLIDLPQGRELAVWKTYRGDIIAASDVVWDSGTALRFIAWKEVEKIFARRKNLASGLYSRASKAFSEGRLGEAAACADWAMTLLEVLPNDRNARSSVMSLKNNLSKTSVAEVPGLSYVGREVEGIRSALGLKNPSTRMTTSKVASPSARLVERRETLPAESHVAQSSRPHIPVLETLPVIAENNCVSNASSGLSLVREYASTPKMTESRMPSKEPSGYDCFITVRAAFIPSYETGASFGIKKGRFGGYLSYMSSFACVKEDYSCSYEGLTDFGYIWATGQEKYSRFSVSSGVLVGITGNLSCYAGAGYGSVGCFWEDVSGQWARVREKSFKGLNIESGLVWAPGRVVLTAGLSSVSFSTISPVIGLGITL